jgi:dTDP-4-dehydrorhamnose 3,5-epimerase-like enzyme
VRGLEDVCNFAAQTIGKAPMSSRRHVNLKGTLERLRPYEISPIYRHDARGKLAKLRVFSDIVVFPLGILDEYTAFSKKNVFRGFHRQLDPHDGNKVFFVLSGEIKLYTLDVALVTGDQYVVEQCTVSENGNAVVVPRGYYTGYLVTSEHAIVQVKSSASYSPNFQKVVPPQDVWSQDTTGSWILSEQDRGIHA